MNFLTKYRNECKKRGILNEADTALTDADFDMKMPGKDKDPEDTTVDDIKDPDPADNKNPEDTTVDDLPGGDDPDPADDEDKPPTDNDEEDPPIDDEPTDDEETESQTRILKLGPVDRELNNIRLADKFTSLQSSIGLIYGKLKDRVILEGEEENIEQFESALSAMRDLRDSFSEYFTHKYMIKSYEENLTFYALVVSEVNRISLILLESKDK